MALCLVSVGGCPHCDGLRICAAGTVFPELHPCTMVANILQNAICAVRHCNCVSAFAATSARRLRWRSCTGTAVLQIKGAVAVPVDSLNSRLATLERSMLAAHKLTLGAPKRTTSNAAVVPSPSHVAGATSLYAATSPDGSDLRDRVAALEAQLSNLRQLESIPSLRSTKSSGLGSNLSLTGANSTQIVQSDSALRDHLSKLQHQIEALLAGKATKADLDSLHLHAAVLGGGSSGSGGAKDDSNVHGAAR